MRYGSPPNPMDQFRDLIRRGGIPVTNALLIANVVTFFALFLGGLPAAGFIQNFLAFDTDLFLHRPWTLFTYPLVATGFLNLLIGGFFLWLSGGSLERSWGSPRFARMFFALSAVFALFMSLGAHVLHMGNYPLDGFNLPLTGLIVAFCALNPEQTLMLYFVPVRARYLIYIVALFTWITYGKFLGLFACGGILVTYLYMTYFNTYGGRGYTVRGRDPKILHLNPKQNTARKVSLDGSAPRSPLDIAGRWRDYQEKKRLEQLLKNSGFTDKNDWLDDDPKRRR
ncbi:hypothetical protein CCAX7_46100 [Capsulimonas corticalis]|uniref:Peptidase S54 rhomboid domain-containing protein n=1 Tax=Capsulimonas corticalis TaxID=2219043 RepID=A0A402D523_9BACT|nr:rhomboid family intramembrane serine protease [Capsulimonas corticalis]BDI32559.1 hypothetical protein CCAX7_46100 [Capsulimonas corticalis]